MPAQRINFYQPEFHPVRVVLPLSQIVRAVALVLAVIMVVSLYQAYSLRVLRKDIVDLEEVKARQTLRLQELGLQVESGRVRPRLETELRQLTHAVDGQQHLLSTLRSGSATQNVRYSAILDGLLSAAPSQLWISGIAVRDAGRDVTLEGTATEPSLLPEYVGRLRASEALQGLPFSVVDMSRGASEGRLRFRMGSREEDTHGKP